jgi:hypothetical protein
MRKILSFLILLSLTFTVSAGPIPSNTGIVAKDIDGNTWDFDALLKVKHIIIHQIFAG